MAALPCALAADKHALSLEDVLRRLEENLQTYDKTVPAFFCDEHAISEMFPGTRRDVVVTDSVFRVRREEAADHRTRFVESRELKPVNSGPDTSTAPDAPAVVEGIFEGALAVVSSSQQPCMRYDLRKQKHDAIVIDFKTVDHPPRAADCLLDEKAHGRVFVDPATLLIKRLEMTAPHHLIRDEQHRWAAPLKGEWVVSVDYAPVTLDGKSFWMPTAINSRVTSDPNTFHSQTWIFKATYSNYHRLQVSSRVLPLPQ
jgi:hypothetical protein